MNKPDGDYNSMSVEERIRLAEQIYISYPRLEEAMRKIKHCHQYSKLSAEPECLLIKGETGAGKTTLYKRYEQKFLRYETEDGTTVPVLSATIPVPATVKSLVTKLLLNLGDHIAESGTTLHQTLRIQQLMKACGVELIILDEFQHFIDRDSRKVLETVSDWLKHLLNETRIPIVLIGMSYSDQILDANKQLKRRFAVKMSLDPFGWETPQQQQEFRKFLRTVDTKLPLPKRSNLADQDMAFRFFCASNGFVANVMKIARRATALALERSMDALDLSLLEQAYEERLATSNPGSPNPFVT